ncbi:MAG TPA: hypothetical protein ENN12_05555 [Epsilonproteobacteria bacterium]|nr:hypothetical protein [Campylobacterota bacterium]
MIKRLLLVVILSLFGFGGEISLPDGFSANFSQEITTPEKNKITYSGEVRFLSPGILKWSYKTPTSKEVCTDGVELMVVDHDLEQVSFFLIDKGLNLPEVIANAKLVRPSVYIAKYEKKEYTLQVDPKGRLSRIAYFDDLENTVLIIFSNVKEGKPTSKSLECTYPTRYDIIEG